MASFNFPRQTAFYKGKVRDVYTIADKYLVMLASDRISAFDVILPRPIPFKGQVLTQIAAHMLKATADICPNWLMSVPAPNVSIGKKCDPFKIEMVVRGNLTGHAWRTYASGKRVLCGAAMPDGMKENDYFPSPIITPSTKAAEGHDEDIAPADIVAQGLATAEEWDQLSDYTLRLFARGKEIAARQGLILVDTKYEFGWYRDELYIIDEVHTPDSSRYWYADRYAQNQLEGKPQEQLSKEFVREWLMSKGFQGLEGQQMPVMDDAFVELVSNRYIHLYEQMTGKDFEKAPDDEDTVVQAIEKSLRR